jgi:hypothetical protein
MGELLVQQGRLTNAQLDSALEEQRESRQPLGEILVARELISRVDLAQALSTQWTWNRTHPEDERTTVEEPPAPERETAAVDERDRLIADLQARVRAAAEEQAAGDARLEALETQVSDLTKAFGVLQRFIRTQSEELEALRASAAEPVLS